MTDRKLFRLSDDIIAQIREILQLALLTNTNVVDHLRAIIVEADTAENRNGYLALTPEYVEAYNSQIVSLQKQAEEAMSAMAAGPEAPPETESSN